MQRARATGLETLVPMEDFVALPGQGVQAHLGGDLVLVVWQSSIDRLIQIDSPSRKGLWFEEKEIPHGQISCHPDG